MTEQTRGIDPGQMFQQVKQDIARLLPVTKVESQPEMNEAAAEQLESGSRIRIHFSKHAVGLGVGEGISTVSVEFMPVSSAPGRERGGIDVSFDDGVALSGQSLASLFSIIVPLQKGSMQLGAVNEHGHQLIEVCFAIPNHPNYLDL
jgi:hypothetical protein